MVVVQEIHWWAEPNLHSPRGLQHKPEEGPHTNCRWEVCKEEAHLERNSSKLTESIDDVNEFIASFQGLSYPFVLLST